MAQEVEPRISLFSLRRLHLGDSSNHKYFPEALLLNPAASVHSLKTSQWGLAFNKGTLGDSLKLGGSSC